MGCYSLLQGIFPIQGLNPHLLRLLHGKERLGKAALAPSGKAHMLIYTVVRVQVDSEVIQLYIYIYPFRLGY